MEALTVVTGGSGGGGLDGGWLQWSEQFEGWQSGQWLGLGAAGCGGGADGLGVGGSWSGVLFCALNCRRASG